MEKIYSTALLDKFVDSILTEAQCDALVKKFFDTKLYEDLDMATKKTKAQLNRIKRTQEKKVKQAQEHLYSVHLDTPDAGKVENGCSAEVAGPSPIETSQQKKNPFDFSFNYDTQGGHFHLSFHGGV